MVIPRYSREILLPSNNDSSIINHTYWKYIDMLKLTDDG